MPDNPYNLEDHQMILEEHSWRCFFDEDLDLDSGSLIADLVMFDPQEIDRVLNSMALLIHRANITNSPAFDQIVGLLIEYQAQDWFTMGHYALMALDTAMTWERG